MMECVHQSRDEVVRGNTRREMASWEKAEKYISVRIGASAAVAGRRVSGIFVFFLLYVLGWVE